MKICLPTFLSLIALQPLSGAVIFNDNYRFVGSSPREVTFDLDQNGTIDLGFRAVSRPVNIMMVTGPPTTQIAWGNWEQFYAPLPLEKGVSVGPEVNYPLYNYEAFGDDPAGGFQLSLRNGIQPTGQGPFLENTGYLGFSFEAEDGVHYGYAYITAPRAFYIEIFNWAYETEPNTPIVTGTVPEPSTAIFLLPILASFAGFRRRSVT